MPAVPLLLPHHRADLRGSGLSDAQVAACGFYSESDPAAVARLLNRTDQAVVALGPCLCLPFVAAVGRAPEYVRCKPDRPRAGDTGKPVKYESPVGVPNRAYVPPATRAALARIERFNPAVNAFAAVKVVGPWSCHWSTRSEPSTYRRTPSSPVTLKVYVPAAANANVPVHRVENPSIGIPGPVSVTDNAISPCVDCAAVILTRRRYGSACSTAANAFWIRLINTCWI